MTQGTPLPPHFFWDPHRVQPREIRLGAHLLQRRTPDEMRQMPVRSRTRVVGSTTAVSDEDPDLA